MRYFTWKASLLDDGQAIGYEDIDDVSIKEFSEKDEYLGLHQNSDGSYVAVQVKKANISQATGYRILLNWLIAIRTCSGIEKFTIAQQTGYSFSDKAFVMDDPALLKTIFEPTKKSPLALCNRVATLYENDEGSLLTDYAYIKEHYQLELISDIDELIYRDLSTPFHKGGVSNFFYEQRVEELKNTILCEVARSIEQKKPFVYTHQQLMKNCDEIVAAICPTRYEPKFITYRNTHPINLYVENGLREVEQLGYSCNSDREIIDHLHYLKYYEHIRFFHLEQNSVAHIDGLLDETYANFRDVRADLVDSGTDTPGKRLRDTKSRPNSYSCNSHEKWGSCIFLTKSDTDPDHLVSWKDD